VEHNARVGEICAARTKGKIDGALPQHVVLKELEQTKRGGRPLETAWRSCYQLECAGRRLRGTVGLARNPVLPMKRFFSPPHGPGESLFVKGRRRWERIVREL